MTEQNTNGQLPEIDESGVQAVHELVVATDAQIDRIGREHTNAYGPALLSMATYLVEKIYASSPEAEKADAVIGYAVTEGRKNHELAKSRLDDPDELGV